MNLHMAKRALEGTVRSELRDHYFGDRELYWHNPVTKALIASGYSGSSHASISFYDCSQFKDDEARELFSCGTLGQVDRNDETGPNEYRGA